MKGRINAHSPDKRELAGINYSRAQSLDRQENRIGCERLRSPFCPGVPLNVTQSRVRVREIDSLSQAEERSDHDQQD
jgi:hypothetical protein